MKFLNLSLVLAGVFFNSFQSQQVVAQKTAEEQLYRPNFHFTPKNHWMNDPNGLYYLDGTYHLFFQYHPYSSKWGPMHWGHATSKDLVKWEEQAIALAPDELGYIFSGSAVVDKNNTSGFGDGKNTPVVAIFTYHDPGKERENKIDIESQGIAFSLDNGKTWTKYEQNPVLKNPGIKDFRDPKVIWDEAHQQWLLVLAAQDKAQFYASKNLKDWSYLSDFGKDLGAHGGVWECPDFFPIQVEGAKQTKWVLIQSLNPGGANGGSGTQYFVGDFDGKTFKMDPLFAAQLQKEKAVWLDWGKDNYASVTFDNVPANKRIIIGWMTNWDYAQDVPTEGWRSSTTVAREVTLRKSKTGYNLLSMPVEQFKQYTQVAKTKTVKGAGTILTSKETDLTKAIIDIDLSNLSAGTTTFQLKNSKGESLSFGIDNTKKQLFIDRSKSGVTNFSEKFGTPVSVGKLPSVYKNAKLKVVLDKTSIEIFFNNGEEVLTETFFPTESYSQFSVATDSQKTTTKIQAHQLKLN